MRSIQREADSAQAQPKGYMRQRELLTILPFSAATRVRLMADWAEYLTAALEH